MNRTTLFRMLCIGAIYLCMQSAFAEGGYVPMLEPGKSWKHNIHAAMSGTVEDWTLKLDQETDIDGQKWFVVNSYSDGVANALNPLCYLREDTTEQKVWVKKGDNGEFSWARTISSFMGDKTDYVLYDFKDYNYTIQTLSGGQVYHIGGFKEGDVDSYPGQVGDNLALVQGLGLVPVGVTKENAFFEGHATSLLGLPAYCDCNDYTYPYLYAVEDAQGERIFEVPELATANEGYKPFVEAGKTWRYKLVDKISGIPEDQQVYPEDVLVISIGESIELDGEDWNPLYVYRMGQSPERYTVPLGYVKEDVTNKLVYWKLNEAGIPEDLNVRIFIPKTPLLYDFENQRNDDAIDDLYGKPFPHNYEQGWIEAEGVRYNGFVGDLGYVERLGIVERLDRETYGESTIFGYIGEPTGMGLHIYKPYIYEITDGEGNVLYQRPENRPSASIVDKLQDTMAISVVDDKVSFSGAAGIPLEIMNMQGVMVWSGSTDSTGRAQSVTLAEGVYVVRHGTCVTKVLVK